MGITKAVTAIAVLALLSGPCFADSNNNSCLLKKCYAGDKGITYATKSEPYFACPTRELVDYTAFVLGLVSMNVQLGLPMPNISDKTGEPEYLDDKSGPNKTRLMLDVLRGEAKVRTFDQALAMCNKGVGKLRVTVMNSPANSIAIWVQNDKTKSAFWLPKGNLDKK